MPRHAALLSIAVSCLLIQQVLSAHIILAIHDSPSLTETEFGLLKSILRNAPTIGTHHIYSAITFNSRDAYLLLNQSNISLFLETLGYLQQGNSSNETVPNLASVFTLIHKHFPDDKKVVVTFLFDSPTSMQMVQEAWSKMDIKKTTFISVLVKANAKANAAATIHFLTKIAKNETKNVLVYDPVAEVDRKKIWTAVRETELKKIRVPKNAENLFCNSCSFYCSSQFHNCPRPVGCVCPKDTEDKSPGVTFGGGGGGGRHNGGISGDAGNGDNGGHKGKDNKSNGEKKGLSQNAIYGIGFGCAGFVIILIMVIIIVWGCKTAGRGRPYGGTRTQLARQMLLAQAMQKASTPSVGPPLQGFFPGPPPPLQNFGAVEAGPDSSSGMDEASKSRKSKK